MSFPSNSKTSTKTGSKRLFQLQSVIATGCHSKFPKNGRVYLAQTSGDIDWADKSLS